MENQPPNKADEIEEQLKESQPVDIDEVLKNSGMTEKQIKEAKEKGTKLNEYGEIISEENST
jgi:hypothetical protein